MTTDDNMPNWRLISLPIVPEQRGNLTIVQGFFDVKRAYWIDVVPGGASRGAHAHKTLRQIIVAMSGSFEVEVNDGKNKKTFTLNRSNKALLINPYTWRDIREFSSGGILLCLASHEYDESDYIHDYNEFLKMVANR